MNIRNWFSSIDRRIRFWYVTTTPFYKDYSAKIRDLGNHAMRLKSEAGSLRLSKAAIPEMKLKEAEEIVVNQFQPKQVEGTTQSMVSFRRQYQGGEKNGYELGDRFDALCNRLDSQIRDGNISGAKTTVRALEEIEARLNHKDKNKVLSRIKKDQKL